MLDELTIQMLDGGVEKKKEEDPDAGGEPSNDEGTGGAAEGNPL